MVQFEKENFKARMCREKFMCILADGIVINIVFIGLNGRFMFLLFSIWVDGVKGYNAISIAMPQSCIDLGVPQSYTRPMLTLQIVSLPLSSNCNTKNDTNCVGLFLRCNFFSLNLQLLEGIKNMRDNNWYTLLFYCHSRC